MVKNQSDKISLTQVSDELKRLSRRIEEIGKTLDLLYQDREILEDVLSRMGAVETAIHLQRSNATENAKDIKENIDEVKDVVEAKVGEVSENLNDKTVIVKSPKQSIIEKIMGKLGGE